MRFVVDSKNCKRITEESARAFAAVSSFFFFYFLFFLPTKGKPSSVQSARQRDAANRVFCRRFSCSSHRFFTDTRDKFHSSLSRPRAIILPCAKNICLIFSGVRGRETGDNGGKRAEGAKLKGIFATPAPPRVHPQAELQRPRAEVL